MLIYFLLCALSFSTFESKTVSTESAMFLGKYYFFSKFNNDVIFCAVDLEDQVSHHARHLYTISATHIPTPCKDNVTVLVDNKVQLQGIEYKAQLSFINVAQDTIDDFHIVITESEEPIVGSTSVYSFAHKIKNEDYSILDLLYKQNKIESKKFTLEIINNPKGNIYFGDIPNDVLSNYTHMMNVPLSDKSSAYWEINIEYIFIDPISYVYTNVYMKTQYRAKLSAKEYQSYVPVSVMDFIKQEIFSEYLNSKKHFSRTNSMIKDMHKKLSKAKYNWTKPEYYQNIFKFKAEKANKKGYIKRSAIDDKGVANIFNGTYYARLYKNDNCQVFCLAVFILPVLIFCCVCVKILTNVGGLA